MSKKLKSKLGITLVALVITIAVLLILAGITIALVFGNNGIMERAINATQTYSIENYKEMIESIANGYKIDKILGKDISIETIRNRLLKEDWIASAEIKEDIIEVIVDANYIYEVDWDRVIFVGLNDKEPFPNVTLSLEKSADKDILTVKAEENKNGIYSIKLVTQNDERIYSENITQIEEKFDIFENGTYEVEVTSNKTKVRRKKIIVDNFVVEEVAKIGATKYQTLQAAVQSVKPGEKTVIEIIRNYNQTMFVEIPKEKDIVIDFANYTVVVTTGGIRNEGKLEVKSTNQEQVGKIEIQNEKYMGVTNYSDLLINSIEIEATRTTNIVGNHGTLNILKSNIIGNSKRNEQNNNYFSPIINYENGNINIENSNIREQIWNKENGNINIKNSTIQAVEGICIVNRINGNITIENVTITAEDTQAIENGQNGTITIKSGIIQAKNASTINNIGTGTINVKGGEIKGAIKTSTSGSSYPTIWNNAGGNIIIEGGNITATTATALYNKQNGKISVINGIIESQTNVAIKNINMGTVEIKGGNITSQNYFAIQNDTGTIAIENGTIHATSATTIYNIGTGTINIKGGNIIAAPDTTASGSTYPGIWNKTGGKIIVEGGEILSTISTAVYNQSIGTVTIENGTITSELSSAINNASTGTVTIKGGNIIGKNAETTALTVTNSTGTILIEGGNIEAVNYALGNSSTGTIRMTGGTVSGAKTLHSTIWNGGTGSIIIEQGTVIAVVKPTIYSTSTGEITIGVNDGIVNNTNPEIVAPNIKATVMATTLNFYDGILKGGFIDDGKTVVNVPEGKKYYKDMTKTVYETTLIDK